MSEQRLIDGNALKEDINVYFADSYHLIDTITERIDAMPTIEERKTGKWKPISDGYLDIYECNQCGETEDYERNFCPYCGAKMEGEEHERK